MTKESTWREAIDIVLGKSPTPLHYNEITERIISEGLRKSLGATPASTVNAQISGSIKHDGEKSPYLRIGPGTFQLKNKTGKEMPGKLTPVIDESEGGEDQYEIITSFGMFWKKDAVEWSATPKLLGMQQIGAKPVDFNKQLGIYLLYDGREIIYVGRTTDRPLGKRLYEHTLDRLSVRWDRFSWFGLLPIDESGNIGELPSSYMSAKLIPAFEAILIEALEPRQNRKRGDDLASVEYIQRADPEIEKRKIKAALEAALNK
jgi:hypothetical protein